MLHATSLIFYRLSLFVGGAVILKSFFNLVSFISFYLGPSSLHQFIYGPKPYALITGATDGIGKATAKELYLRGFNVILHGRNPEKLHRVMEELRALGSREAKSWVADASSDKVDFRKAVEEWKDLEITLVVHNVGSSPMRPGRIDEISEDDLLDDIRRNALFPFLLSRAILPKLRKASGPAQMVYVGSFAGDGNMMRLAAYAASKAFLKRMSCCLGMDERFWVPTNVSTMAVVVGSVVSSTHKVAQTAFSPSSETYAKALVDKIGCGRKVVVPFLMHAVQFLVVRMLPEAMADKAIAQAMEEELRLAKKD